MRSKNAKDCVLFKIFVKIFLSRLSGYFSKFLLNAGTVFQDFPRCREVLQNFPCRVPDFSMFYQKLASILFTCLPNFTAFSTRVGYYIKKLLLYVGLFNFQCLPLPEFQGIRPQSPRDPLVTPCHQPWGTTG